MSYAIELIERWGTATDRPNDTLKPAVLKSKPVIFDGWELESGKKTAGRVLEKFLSLDAKAHDLTKRRLYSYYLDIDDQVGGGSIDPRENPPQSVNEIWEHVHPKLLFIEDRNDVPYVVLEADCSWSPEHGVMMCWRDGEFLTKVGHWNGHLTNVDASGNPGLVDVVYDGIEQRFTTFQDES